MRKNQYQPVIGLEIHVQLKTKRKMFCGCDANIWQKEPNTHVCPVCLGLPGALPVPNSKAIELTQLMGLALNCKLARQSKFDRKSYFYPDLPKGYQISQYDQPLAASGKLKIKAQRSSQKLKLVRIKRVHLEEDTAKSLHQGDFTLIDFNKSGVPLMEIVTEPDLGSADQAVEFGKKIQQIARWVGVSDADMEKGQLRIELNISMQKLKSQNLKPVGQQPGRSPDYYYKVEVKNINSFRFLGRIIEYEKKRQGELLSNGKTPTQETRGWNEKGETTPQRTKETEADYRYFPEPDIPPLIFSREHIRSIKAQLPALPDELIKQYLAEYNLSEATARELTRSRKLVNYFEELVKLGMKANKAANLIINRPEVLQVSARETLQAEEKLAAEVIDSKEELGVVIQKIIEQNPGPVKEYRAGKSAVLKFLLGQVMKATRGKASPRLARRILQQALS